MRRLLATLLMMFATPSIAAAPESALTTVAERSGFVRTGRYDEVGTLCREFEQAHPKQVRCFEFGRSPEGRPMLALAVSASGALTPEAAREQGVPVLLFQGGIHAGEIDGKDAGFLALRELLQGRAAPRALDRVAIVFVPVFNVDGHERFGRWNRPNQRGPEEMGWRVTSQNLNLNRDYAKADAPEMQAMLRLIEAWDPIVYTDLHATDGAQFEHDISIVVEPVYSGDDALRGAGLAMRDELMARLTKHGSLPLPFYPSFVVGDDPASGFEANVPPPRFSTGYMPLRNRFAVLVETHSWKPYRERVASTRNLIVDLVGLAVTDGEKWLGLAKAADQRAARLGGAQVPLDYKVHGAGRTIPFRGYAYTRTPSEVSGALMTRYDERTPQVWNIPLRDDVRPGLLATAPQGGYIVPLAHAQRIGPRLAAHGISFRALGAPVDAEVEEFHASKATFDPVPFENRQRLTVEGEWHAKRRALAAGAVFVPIAQAKARLVVALLEPQAGDSYAAWGEFNAHFERKEYMEGYVSESVARELLARDPKLAAEFHDKLASDPAFAQSPVARLEFFYQRHASWDATYNVYPVLRVASVPAAN